MPPPLYFAAAFGGGMLLRAATVPLAIGGRRRRPWFSASSGSGCGRRRSPRPASSISSRHHTTIVPHHPVSTLVTTGVYRFTRNPMYTGLAVAYLGGAALLVGSWWPVATLGLAAAGRAEARHRSRGALSRRQIRTCLRRLSSPRSALALIHHAGRGRRISSAAGIRAIARPVPYVDAPRLRAGCGTNRLCGTGDGCHDSAQWPWAGLGTDLLRTRTSRWSRTGRRTPPGPVPSRRRGKRTRERADQRADLPRRRRTWPRSRNACRTAVMVRAGLPGRHRVLPGAAITRRARAVEGPGNRNVPHRNGGAGAVPSRTSFRDGNAWHSCQCRSGHSASAT